MTKLVQELKTRARLQLNASRRAGGGQDLQLRDCLHDAAREAGFRHWEHARGVLSGRAQPGDDHGAFWYTPRCAGVLNAWFARYDEACDAHAANRGAVLLPYGRQFVLARDAYLIELGLDPASPLWAEAGRDLVSSYGSPPWEQLAWLRLCATRSSPHRP